MARNFLLHASIFRRTGFHAADFFEK